MEEVQYTAPSDYEHQIVSTESAECECGASHDEGHALWGGKLAPDEMGGYEPIETVTNLHSVEVEYRHT